MLCQIATHRRLKNWKETTIEYLKYARYAAIASDIIFAMIKCGFFEFFSNCIPKKICLFCVKSKVDVNPQVVTYSASEQPLLEQVQSIRPRRIRM